jgi:DNA-binding transcriptional regulator LsrR (DeoR family)
VGDVCAIHFDIQGNVIDVPLTRQMIGIDAPCLRAIPIKIGVAGGPSKIAPILGASRARLINMLISDETTATSILRELMENGNQLVG